MYLVNDIPCNQLDNYKYGDCGKQYGWLWRNWENQINEFFPDTEFQGYGQHNDKSYYEFVNKPIDQIKNIIEGLKTNPEGRRHIITAWNPTTLDDMALNACHAFVQFNCRKIVYYNTHLENKADELNLPKYYLDCQLYQRSADMFLG
jgi:thymidylate synthase